MPGARPVGPAEHGILLAPVGGVLGRIERRRRGLVTGSAQHALAQRERGERHDQRQDQEAHGASCFAEPLAAVNGRCAEPSYGASEAASTSSSSPSTATTRTR